MLASIWAYFESICPDSLSVNNWSKEAGLEDDNGVCVWLWVDESHAPWLFRGYLPFCWIREPTCNCWQDSPQILFWWAETRANGERQTMAWGDEQSGVRVRECLILWARRYLYGLPWVNRLWCWENRPGTAGPHFGSVATTTWYISLWCHLIPLSAVITSVWMFDFQAYFVQWVRLLDCVPQITWSVDYIHLGVWILGLQNMATS